MNTSDVINKNISTSYALIGDLIYSVSFTAIGGPEFLDGRKVSFVKTDKQSCFPRK